MATARTDKWLTRDPRLKSKWWRLTHLYKIKDKDGRIVTFKPNTIQLLHLAQRKRQRRARILKYRQGGFTTLYLIDYLDDCLFTPGYGAGIIAHEREALDRLFLVIKRAYDNLPDSLKPETKQNTLRRYHFLATFDGQPLDSEIYVALKVRSGTLQALHISERAYIEGEASQELEAGSKQAIGIYGRITEETTAKGFNEFHDSFMEDYNNPAATEFDYACYFYAWHQMPEYTLPGTIAEFTPEDLKLKDTVRQAYNKELTDGQILWYNWKMRDLEKAARASEDKIRLTGRQLMKQEYPSTMLEAFQSGAGAVFDSELLEQEQAVQPVEIYQLKGDRAPEARGVKGEHLRIWHKPEPHKNYYIGVDPSDGTGGDDAGFAVWDEDYRKCAELKTQLRPDLLAEAAAEIGWLFNEAFVGVENNMLSTILFLSKIYENYFVTVVVDEKRDRRTKKIGWTTTGKSRDVMIDDFVMHFEEGSLEINSSVSLKEMQTFVKKEGGKREHAVGKSDDMLFADFIALQMIKYKDRGRHRKRVFSSKPSGL